MNNNNTQTTEDGSGSHVLQEHAANAVSQEVDALHEQPKKRVLATATAVTTLSKRRMSVKNRRVSFAPDTELTMVRTFEKDLEQSPGVMMPMGGVGEEELPQGEPMMVSPPMAPSHRVSMGEITSGLPTLGELAEEEEHEPFVHDNVTAGVPRLGMLLEEDIMYEEYNKKEQGEEEVNQENKWGFMPGNDDTLDLDLKGHGKMFMGDKTYNKLYADNITANSLASIDVPDSVEKSDGAIKKGPDWAAPAFGAPQEQHPALDFHSPNFTDSSIGTASTRRVSVDARRMSVTSRRMSMAGNVRPPLPSGRRVREEDDDEEDLLAESPNSMNAKSFDVLAGLKSRLSSVTKPSPHKRRSLPLVPEDMEMPQESFHSPTASGAHIMYKSPPPSATSGRRQSISQGRPSFYSNPRDSIGTRNTTPGSVSKSVMRTPVRSNAIVPVGGNSNSLAPPGSAIAARYPGSAIATGRLSQGFTPSRLAPITFQDFAKIVEVQFLDNLRRGASINYADLQPNPVPANLKESYSLLCITSPNVAELETAIHTLQSEISRLRGSASDLEVMLGQTNPAIFRHVQTASYEQLEALRNNVASLKKACRAKATALLKDVRCQMEESKFGRLSRAHDGLKADLSWLHEVKRHTQGIARAAAAFAAEKRQYMAKRRKEIESQRELKQRLEATRRAVEERVASNREREEQLVAIESSANNLDAELNQIDAEKLEIEASIQHGRVMLKNASVVSSASIQVGDNTPEHVARMLGMMELYEKCSGMKIHSCSSRLGAFTCIMEIAGAFFMELSYMNGSEGVTVSVHPRHLPGGLAHNLAMRLFSERETCSFSCEKNALVCLVQHLVAQLNQAASAAKELEGIRAECHGICEIVPTASQYDSMGQTGTMSVKIGFLKLHSGVRFSIILNVNDLTCQNVDIIFGGEIIDESLIHSTIHACQRHPTSKQRGLASICKAISNIAPTIVSNETGNPARMAQEITSN